MTWYVHSHGAYRNHHHPHKGSHAPRPGERGKHHKKHHSKPGSHRRYGPRINHVTPPGTITFKSF